MELELEQEWELQSCWGSNWDGPNFDIGWILYDTVGQIRPTAIFFAFISL